MCRSGRPLRIFPVRKSITPLATPKRYSSLSHDSTLTTIRGSEFALSIAEFSLEFDLAWLAHLRTSFFFSWSSYLITSAAITAGILLASSCIPKSSASGRQYSPFQINQPIPGVYLIDEPKESTIRLPLPISDSERLPGSPPSAVEMASGSLGTSMFPLLNASAIDTPL